MAGYREGYGIHGDHGDDGFSEDMHQGRERGYEDRHRGESHFDQNRQRSAGRHRDDDRFLFGREDERGGFFERARDQAGSRRADRIDDAPGGRQDRESWRVADEYRQRFGILGHEGHYGGDRDDRLGMSRHRPGSFSGSSQDDHYRSWRDRQIQALDRDYQDYCREREQRFHQDFDSWRKNRSVGLRDEQMSGSPGTQGMSPGTHGEGQAAAAGQELSGGAGESGTLTLDTPADSGDDRQGGEDSPRVSRRSRG